MNFNKFAKYFRPVAVLGILLLSVGCTEESSKETTKTTESESVQNIRAVLNEQLNGPDEELQKITEGLGSGDIEKFSKKRSEYLEENFKPYVSDRFYENYVIKQNMAYSFIVFANGKVKVEDISIEESESTENSFNFTADVSYMKHGERKTINASGIMNTNEEGKVVRILYHNPSELKNTLSN